MIGSAEHVLLFSIAAGGEEGVHRDALLAQRSVLDRLGSGNGPIQLLIDQGVSRKAAEKQMRDTLGQSKAIAAYAAHTVDKLIEQGCVLSDDGRLTLGAMPEGYDPVERETADRRSTSLVNLVSTRRRAGGWTYFINPDLDESTVARMAETMQREGWPQGHTVLLDAEGNVADGKHHIAAADVAGIDWTAHTVTISDEVKLWQEVEHRNVNRWNMGKREMAKKRAEFIALRADLSVGERMARLREAMAASGRTTRRAAADVKKDVKEERDAAVKEGLSSGKSVRQVAEETGVSKSTVDRVAKTGEVSQNGQVGQNGTPPEIVGECCICRTGIEKGDKTVEILAAVEGFRFGGTRSGGGYNAIKGVYEKTGEIAHVDCMSRVAQVAYRSRSK